MSLAARAEQITAFTGGRIIDGTGQPPMEHSGLVIAGDRIIAIGKIDPAFLDALSRSGQDEGLAPCG